MAYDKSKDALYMYNLLCTVIPPSKETKFPYNPWTPDKIEVTLGELELFPNGQIFMPAPVHPSSSYQGKKTGGGNTGTITVFSQ